MSDPVAQPVVQVDAFTAERFRGNPAAVCVLPRAATDEWMQAVAREMNLSETAFLVARPDGDWDLRWFTPAAEVDLCGHATLASAHALWGEGHVSGDALLRFHTRSGILTARRDGDWIEMDFPAEPAQEVPPPDGLLGALGLQRASWVGRNRMDYLVRVASEAEVHALEPDMARLRALDVRGVMVTSEATSPEFDFISRFFAPGVGVDEDPVTGSAHCCLGPYWASVLGRPELTAYQASARGGVVRVRLLGDRVRLAGQAVTVLRGAFA